MRSSPSQRSTTAAQPPSDERCHAGCELGTEATLARAERACRREGGRSDVSKFRSPLTHVETASLAQNASQPSGAVNEGREQGRTS